MCGNGMGEGPYHRLNQNFSVVDKASKGEFGLPCLVCNKRLITHTDKVGKTPYGLPDYVPRTETEHISPFVRHFGHP